LVCDDQSDVRHALRLLLKSAGYQAETVESPRALLKAAQADGFDLILADLNYTKDTTSGQEGLDLIAALQAQGITVPLVVMTAWGSIDLAVEAMRRGACDFIQKPWDNLRVLATIREQAEHARSKRSELDDAASVQRKMLPADARELATIALAGRSVAARGIGGDYYDFLDLGARMCAFVLADVSGKGVSAALLAANLQACIRSRPSDDWRAPSAALNAINRHLRASTGAERFATLFFATYSERDRILRYVNCGHCPPLLIRGTGETIRLDVTATILGVFADWKCDEAEARLDPGDKLVACSDGVTEATDAGGEEFGEERLTRLVQSSRADGPSALADEIVQAVSAFSGPSRSDDVTAVAAFAR
jgi:sigma-B regulation protein RsbU (phosphoserine phosphatase)